MRFSSGGEPQKRVEIKEKRKPRNVFAIVGESVHVIVCQKAICKCIEFRAKKFFEMDHKLHMNTIGKCSLE